MNDPVFCVYIMTSARNGTLYVGMTDDLPKRVYEHKSGFVLGFAKRYTVSKLVYYECCDDFHSALTREKRIKKWRRKWKLGLIEGMNPNWTDLSDTLGCDIR